MSNKSAYGVDNLASLPELDEQILLEELKVRYQQNFIYVSWHTLAENYLMFWITLLPLNITEHNILCCRHSSEECKAC